MSSNKTQPARKRTSLLFTFVLLAVIVVFAGYYYQQHYAVPIEESAISSTDSVHQETKEAGEAFLLKKSQESGVQSLGGGVLYKELQAGHGASPTQQSTVVVHYEGRLIDGTIFDSSYERGEPAEFPVGGVVAGWQIALKAMKPGSIWEVYLPHYLGYGASGSGEKIAPYSALVFKIELKEVK